MSRVKEELAPQDYEMTDAVQPAAGEGGLREVDLADLDAMFSRIPSGPYSADARGESWEVRAIDTDPTNDHHWPYRLCESIRGQKAGCDPDVFGFIAGVINAWPSIRSMLDYLRIEAEEQNSSRCDLLKAIGRARQDISKLENLLLNSAEFSTSETARADQAEAAFDAHDELLHQCLDERDRLREAAAKPARHDEWQPIDTAPKTGLRILLWYPEAKIHVGKGLWKTETAKQAMGYWVGKEVISEPKRKRAARDANGGYWSCDFNHTARRISNASLWMPLPANPPAQEPTR